MTEHAPPSGTGGDTGTTTRPPASDAARVSQRGQRAAAAWWMHLVTVLLGGWVMAGLMVDGWAHATRAALETFFTPWHALFYAGVAAMAGWMGWMVSRGMAHGRRGWAAVPHGYALGIGGLVLFAAGGLGDLVWHSVVGVERGLDALLSPTHLVLLAGLTLVLTSPLRAAWSTPAAAGERPSLLALLPAVLSITLVTALFSLFVLYLSVFDSIDALRERPLGTPRAPRAGTAMGELSMRAGLGSILVTNVLLVAPLLLLLRRWRLPFGSVAILFTGPAVLLTSIHAFALWPLIPMALASGLLTDGLIAALRLAPDRAGAVRIVAAVTPLILWSTYMLTVTVAWDTWWSVELVVGVVVLGALSGLALSYLAFPPAAPGVSSERG